MQKVLEERFHTNRLGKVDLRFKNAHKVNFIRYADDFIVTAATEGDCIRSKRAVEGLPGYKRSGTSDEKTVVTHINEGFDFLGWTFRKFKGKLIIKPSKKSIKAIVSKLSDTINRRGKAWNQDVLIMKLNQQIRGWTNYHQSVSASEAFDHLTMCFSNCSGTGQNGDIRRRENGGFQPSIGTAKATETGFSAQRNMS